MRLYLSVSLSLLVLLTSASIAAQTASKPDQRKLNDALYEACLDGEIEAVQKAIKDGADVNSYYSNGRTPLIAAALSLHYKVIDALLKAGARAEMQNDAGETAAELLGLAKIPPDADESEGLALARFLAEKRACEKKLNDAAAPATELAKQFMYLVLSGDQAGAIRLIAKGVYRDFKDKRSQTAATALIIAAYRGRLEVAKTLIEKGVRIDRADAKGYTPLVYAVEKQDLEMVTLLVREGGADPRIKVGGRTIVAFAKTKPNKQIADLLFYAGVAADFLENAEPLELNLDEFKISLDEKTKPGTAGKTTLTDDEKELFKIVNDRKTLHYMLEGSTDRVIELLRKGTNANVRDASGKTPVMRAAENDDGFLITTLRNHGKADLNATMPNGTTALMLVAKADVRAAADQLLYLGADKNLKDKAGKTAYDYAVQRNGEVLAKLGSALKPN